MACCPAAEEPAGGNRPGSPGAAAADVAGRRPAATLARAAAHLPRSCRQPMRTIYRIYVCEYFLIYFTLIAP